MNRLPFRLETRDRKLLGVCAGIGRSMNIDPTFVRIAWVAVPLLTFVTVWQALLAYFICGLIGAVATSKLRRRHGDFERMGEQRRTTTHELRTKLDATDRRLMAIDHHLHNSESDALAREIEALRKEQA
ncbi:PspC domain-containing protein [Sphingomonas sp. LHG3406-1]|uniref:PspC domain-containing protein n=1 Tax=Sphingomonas sp. LHG3406-1 TaxID=2804617 RepID=UPI002605FCC8|nr:PspC domain-containing protein [Sphingomonas sp. LHG3406-1]